jgi:hypothetical protein
MTTTPLVKAALPVDDMPMMVQWVLLFYRPPLPRAKTEGKAQR